MAAQFYEDVVNIIRAAVKEHGNASSLAAAAGVSPANISYWTNCKRSPRLTEVGPLLDYLGVKLALTGTTPSRDVCFVKAQVVSAEDGAPPPVAEDYVAAPLVGEVGAGPGYIPQETIKSWFLAYKHLPAIRHRLNLIAVEIGAESTSMQPTLNPGDIVLVDRDDRDVLTPGKIMLVLDPQDGSGSVKRVSVTEEDGDFKLNFYSDNGAKFAPHLYSLRHDFAGDWNRAIVGRVIWAWNDMTKR